MERMSLLEKVGLIDYYSIPRVCEKCGGVMVFKGVGEYRCENCGEKAYDDYGKVRLYIEEHRGATAAEIEKGVGVSQKTIRRLLKEGRLEVAENSKSFLSCEVCGKKIRSGRYCPECEVNVHRKIEEQQREMLRKDKHAHGYGGPKKGEEGQKRFRRDS